MNQKYGTSRTTNSNNNNNNGSAEKAVGNLLVNQLLIGNSKNIFVIILTSLLSVYVTQYTTRKINSFRKLMQENPLFLLWGMLNVLTGKPFFNDRKSIQNHNNIQPEKRKEEELKIDENEIDEDIYYIKLHHQKNRKDNGLPLNLENIGGMAVNAANVFTRVKRYITAEDILQQNMSQQQTSQNVDFSDYFVNGSSSSTAPFDNFSNTTMPNVGSNRETILPKI